jgi:hypothetical protein
MPAIPSALEAQFEKHLRKTKTPLSAEKWGSRYSIHGFPLR